MNPIQYTSYLFKKQDVKMSKKLDKHKVPSKKKSAKWAHVFFQERKWALLFFESATESAAHVSKKER